MTRASRWVLAVAIAGSALAVGTVHTITLCIVTAVLAVAAVMAWWGAEPMKARSAATLLLFTGIGLTAYTALQCVPMPIGWLAVIAPHNADVWSRALSPLHEPGPSWAPISLDPTATRVEVLKGVAYLLAFVTALRVARKREGVRFLSAAIVVTAIALALAALLHPAFGAKKLFGLYEPSAGILDRHIAPLINPNNLAGYINVAICLSLAALLAPEPSVPRPIAGAAVVVLGAVQVWVGSRGGVIAMVFGAITVIGIARITRARHSGTVPGLALAAGAMFAVGTALFVLSGSDEVSNELLDTDVSKLHLLGTMFRSVPAMPFLGCGRGSFESVFPAFRIEPGYVTYTHPENFAAQWVVEWGLPIGIVGLIAVAFALRPNVVLARSTTAGGAWAAIAAMTVQNMGDLGSEVPGLVLPCVICAAIVVAGTPGNKSRKLVDRWAGRPRAIALCVATTVPIAILLAVGVVGRELNDDQNTLHQMALVERTSAIEMRTAARAAMKRHPSEPYLPFAAALRAARDRDEDPIPWLGGVIERSREYGPAHLLLARVVSARSPSQARLEYRLAMEQAPNLVASIMAEAPRMVTGYFGALELLPSGKENGAVSELLAQAVDDRLPATRFRLDAEVMERLPAATGPAWRMARDAVQDIEADGGAPWCDGSAREGCVHDALDKSIKLERMAPDKCAGHMLHARARAAEGDAAGGVAELGKAVDDVVDRPWCLEQLVALARQHGNEPRAEAALEKIVTIGCGDEVTCAEHLRWVGQQYEAMGKPHRALTLFRRAFQQVPDDNLLAHMAELAASGGLHAEAAADYEQLAHRHPEDDQWRHQAAVQHDAAMQQAIKL
jgi:hypothetical protein